MTFTKQLTLQLNTQRYFSQSPSNPSHEITEYTEASLKKQTDKQLRIIAKNKKIQIPRGAKKDLIVQLILSNQSKERNVVIQNDTPLGTIVTNVDG